jgi:hypothetical protein
LVARLGFWCCWLGLLVLLLLCWRVYCHLAGSPPPALGRLWRYLLWRRGWLLLLLLILLRV